MTTNIHVGLSGLRDALVFLENTNNTLDGASAVGTSAFWACALDEQLRAVDSEYERRRDDSAGGRLLPGIRLVRNAVTHGAVVAVEQAPRLVLPMRLPTTLTHLAYRPLEDVLRDWVGNRIQTKDIQRQDEIYRAHIAGTAVLDTMAAAYDWFVGDTGLTTNDFPWRGY
ncbi:hypothetical protein [Curtobacterium sp. MCBD17_040]|uniref:hypothetical protein n=1 Tax=Curtobacterium sp. MCBD17_040 TaxID=2175674 RepID=UPI000DAA345F|nr:hypothetical protein [Curtobacterium sp. MCBD17_040]WIB64046.1 hypothetical protein DEI94_02290 [Curtobacterium sp. MCBD17_040]